MSVRVTVESALIEEGSLSASLHLACSLVLSSLLPFVSQPSPIPQDLSPAGVTERVQEPGRSRAEQQRERGKVRESDIQLSLAP